MVERSTALSLTLLRENSLEASLCANREREWNGHRAATKTARGRT